MQLSVGLILILLPKAACSRLVTDTLQMKLSFDSHFRFRYTAMQ